MPTIRIDPFKCSNPTGSLNAVPEVCSPRRIASRKSYLKKRSVPGVQKIGVGNWRRGIYHQKVFNSPAIPICRNYPHTSITRLRSENTVPKPSVQSFSQQSPSKPSECLINQVVKSTTNRRILSTRRIYTIRYNCVNGP